MVYIKSNGGIMFSKHYQTHLIDEADRIEKVKGQKYFAKCTNFLATYDYLMTCTKDEFVCTMHSLYPDYPILTDEEFDLLTYRWNDGVFSD